MQLRQVMSLTWRVLSEGYNRNMHSGIFAWAILLLNNVSRKTTQSEEHPWHTCIRTKYLNISTLCCIQKCGGVQTDAADKSLSWELIGSYNLRMVYFNLKQAEFNFDLRLVNWTTYRFCDKKEFIYILL
jgi:hypothetical protein